MNKIMVILGVGIWGVMLILRFIFRLSLEGMGLGCDEITANLMPLSIIEIVAFIITVVGIFKRD